MHGIRVVTTDGVEALAQLDSILESSPVVVHFVSCGKEGNRVRLIHTCIAHPSNHEYPKSTSLLILNSCNLVHMSALTFECGADASGKADPIKIVIKDLILLDDTTPAICHFNSCGLPAKYPVFLQYRLTGRADENTCRWKIVKR